jgi:gluconolactonase
VLTGTPTRVYNATGNGQFEGTVWDANAGVLFFSNMSTGSTNPVVPSQVQRLTPPGTVDTPVTDSGTNGLALDVDGSLLGCSHKVQGIVRINPTAGTVSTLFNTDSNGKHFNSPNDLTVRSDGTIYFTDPDYQLGSSRTSETGTKGIYRVTPARQVSLVDGTFGEPNGVVLSPDESTLYVADTTGNAIRKFTIASDGTASGKVNFATITTPDGVAVDCAGNLYWASNTPGRVIVFSPSGTQLGSITVATGATNVAFGGTDRKTLYISAGMAIYSLALNVPGYPY